VWRVASAALWVVTAVAMVGLGLRFGLRAVGVRDDIAFPGMVYRLTAPLVEPFYRYFPVSERFDEGAVEVATLAAAGSVLAVALGVYVVGLLVAGGGRSQGVGA
jgi:hypothetical protein